MGSAPRLGEFQNAKVPECAAHCLYGSSTYCILMRSFMQRTWEPLKTQASSVNFSPVSFAES